MVSRLGRALAIAALCTAVGAPLPAHAAEIRTDGSHLTYKAGSGEVNTLTVSVRDGQVQFSDPAVKVDGGDDSGCSVSSTVATCKLGAGADVRVKLGDRDDSVRVDAGAAQLDGGDGNDTLIGGPGADELEGGSGDDLLQGRGGTDVYEPDDGFDRIDYTDHTDPVTASFDGVANDGSAGENEMVPADAEFLIGGQGPDKLYAGPGGSYLQGSPGRDTLYGGPGADTIYGGKDGDVLYGGAGVDRLFGDLGSDLIYADDGIAESVTCGDDFDYFHADALDTLVGCEQAGDPPAGPGGGPSGGGSGAGAGAGSGVPPQPQLGRTVIVEPARGTVTVRPPGGSAVELGAGDDIPIGSVVDTTRGAVDLTSAAGTGGGTQSARFSGGIFKVAQSGGARPITELVLSGPIACPSGRSRVTAAGRRARSRHLWGSGHGRFRTRGRGSSATVRGTIWLTEDRCDGTLTRVKRGVVAVKDFRTGKTTPVRAGKSYFAAATKPRHR